MSGICMSRRTIWNGRLARAAPLNTSSAADAALDRVRLGAPAHELLVENAPIDRVVVDNEDANGRQTERGRTLRRRDAQFKADFDVERAPLPFFALDPEAAVHQLHQAAADRKPQAGSTEPPCRGSVSLAEGLENHGMFLRRMPIPVSCTNK